MTDAVEKVRSIRPTRNNRIIGVDFLNRTCAFDPHFESILLRDPPFSDRHVIGVESQWRALFRAYHSIPTRPRLPEVFAGQSNRLCPDTSDIDLFHYGKGVVNFNPEVAYGALDLGVTEQQLDRTQVAGSAIDQRGLGTAK